MFGYYLHILFSVENICKVVRSSKFISESKLSSYNIRKINFIILISQLISSLIAWTYL